MCLVIKYKMCFFFVNRKVYKQKNQNTLKVCGEIETFINLKKQLLAFNLKRITYYKLV